MDPKKIKRLQGNFSYSKYLHKFKSQDMSKFQQSNGWQCEMDKIKNDGWTVVAI